MKKIKALIIIEAKAALFMGLYFLAVNLGILMIIQVSINRSFMNYLNHGMGGATEDLMGYIFLRHLRPMIIFMGLGLILLVYFQFRNDKNIEIGRFIKSLPYTEEQRCFIKLGTGILSYTIPFIIGSIGQMMLREYAVNKFSDIYSLLPYEEIVLTVNASQNLMNLLLLTFLVCTFIYLFIFMLQFLINHNIGALVIGILTLVSPVFMIMSINYIGCLEKFTYSLNNIADRIVLPFYTVINAGIHMDIYYTQAESFITSYRYIKDISFKMCVSAAASLLCLLIITLAVKRYRIEKSDIFMPYLGVRVIFVVGVILCAGFVWGDIGALVLRGGIVYNEVISWIEMIAGGALGLFIAYKIAHIGIARRG